MKNNPDVIIKCDFCKKKHKGKNILHYSGYVNGELANHLHICINCFKKLGLKLQKITSK